MKKIIFILSTFLLTSCAAHAHKGPAHHKPSKRVVVVVKAKPPVPVGTMFYTTHTHHSWQWVPGHYNRRGAWVRGHWVKRVFIR